MAERLVRGVITETVAGRRARQMEMIFSLGDLFENPPPGTVHDVSLLPHPKAELLQALEEQIETHPDKNIVEVFSASAVILSGYQEGVGQSVNIPTPADFEAAKADNAKLRALLSSIDGDKLKRFTELAQQESESIYAMVQAAKARNPIMQPKPFWKRLLGR